MESIEKQSLFESLPPVRDMAAVTEQYAALFADREDYCVVVLDDDPDRDSDRARNPGVYELAGGRRGCRRSG